MYIVVPAMKIPIFIVLVAATSANPDSGERKTAVRPIVSYADDGSSVNILRGAELSSGRTSHSVRPRVRYVQETVPRVRYVSRPRVRYVQATPKIRYTTRRARPQYVRRVAVPRYTSTVVERPALYVRPKPKPAVRYSAVTPAPQPKVRLTAVKEASSESEESYTSETDYKFGYEVRDDDTYNYQARQETRQGNKVSGSYVVHDPDGYLRTVRYGDDGNGFYAIVTREPVNLFGSSTNDDNNAASDSKEN